MSALGDYLREKRLRRDVGLRELARRSGISATYLSRVETGEETRAPSEEALTAIAHALGEPDAVNALMRAARRVPEDVLRMLRDDPGLIDALRSLTKVGMDSVGLKEILVKAGVPVPNGLPRSDSKDA